MNVPSGRPTFEKARELALSQVGLGLLGTGFFLHLGGYVVLSGDAWFVVVAAAVIFGAGAGGSYFVVPVAAMWIHARATADWDFMERAREDNRS